MHRSSAVHLLSLLHHGSADLLGTLIAGALAIEFVVVAALRIRAWLAPER